jgi:hypothetical protein
MLSGDPPAHARRNSEARSGDSPRPFIVRFQHRDLPKILPFHLHHTCKGIPGELVGRLCISAAPGSSGDARVTQRSNNRLKFVVAWPFPQKNYSRGLSLTEAANQCRQAMTAPSKTQAKLCLANRAIRHLLLLAGSILSLTSFRWHPRGLVRKRAPVNEFPFPAWI